MSADDDFSFAPPAFKPEESLQQIKLSLRDLKLAERGNGYELRGKRVAEAEVDGALIRARIARRLMVTPEWDRSEITSSADQRKFIDEVKKRLARWEHED